MRKKLTENEKKPKIAISINRRILEVIKEDYSNISRGIETLLYEKLTELNKIEKLKL
jgi:hypothetical protein